LNRPLKFSPTGYAPNVWDVTERLDAQNAYYKTGRRVVEITKDSVVTLLKNKVREVFAADVVIIALGVKSENHLGKTLAQHFARVSLIGDAEQTGRIASAVRSGFKAARALTKL
jgi:predicted NAD/FAD-dependent oxidoreductase